MSSCQTPDETPDTAPRGAPSDTPSFEETTRRLDAIVGRLSRPDTPLDAALALFQEGVGLLRVASASLETTEAALVTLVESAEGALAVRPLEG